MTPPAPPSEPARLRMGIDSGGTFTDVTVFDECTGDIHICKVSSTPDDPSVGIYQGVKEALARFQGSGAAAPEVVYFGHGTTVATNALIQGRGSRTGLITTAGFRDLLELRRQRRPSLYDLQVDKPVTLAPRNLRLEVRERVMFDGRIETPLDEADVRYAVRALKAEGVASVAVCLLFSFVEPAHEITIKRILQEEFPEAFVSISHEVAPEYREFERLSTVVVNAYLGPIMKSYLERLKPRLESANIRVAPHLTQSNGGVISFDIAQAHPARTVLSGPAAGVTGALAVAGLSGIQNIITFDMGGTSSDVSLIDAGRPTLATDLEVHGYPLKLPMLDIHTVGAGGGSIAYEDNGLLKVGPRSAGAAPGPACYGLGATLPTVTDANVVLQVLNPEYLLNGRMKIDSQAAHDAVQRLGLSCGLDTMRAAQGIISVVIANMAKAIRVISVERGYDPRDYTLMAFGGAGPIHAGRLARELETRNLLIPQHPGTLCSMGLLLTDLRSNLSVGRLITVEDRHGPTIDAAFAVLEARALDWFEHEAVAPERRSLTRTLDMRYSGQSHELSVQCPLGQMNPAAIRQLIKRFEQVFRQMYGYIAEGEPVQIVTLRVEATAFVPKARLAAHAPASGSVAKAVITWRDVFIPEAGGWVSCPIYDRDRLGPGHIVHGPCIIEQMDTTTLLLPGQQGTVDVYLNLLIEELA